MLSSILSAAEPIQAEPARLDSSQWVRTDTLIMCGLLAPALAMRFWHLARPAEMVFDERLIIPIARCLLHGSPCLGMHPLLPQWSIVLSIAIFGDRPWSCRLPSAALGTILVGVTYLLGRRMLGSRLAATLSATFVLCDGLFLVDSRFALREIFYVTFAAWSYLMLFRFAQTPSPLWRRRITLLWMALALGLGLSSKLLVPAVALVFVAAALAGVMVHAAIRNHSPISELLQQLGGALTLIGSVSALVYLVVSLPNYWLGSWGGIGDQFAYLIRVIRFNAGLSSGHAYASPWWSWPLMLRPIVYWTKVPVTGMIARIEALGNPVIWWGALISIPIVAVQAIRLKCSTYAFIVIGYAIYVAMWIPIHRYLFVYEYMPALYLAFMALAIVLAQSWQGKARDWEHLLLLMSLLPALVLGLGTVLGSASFFGMTLIYVVLRHYNQRYAGRWVCLLFLGGAFAAFLYLFPLWMGLPMRITRYYGRMWLHGPGLANWT